MKLSKATLIQAAIVNGAFGIYHAYAFGIYHTKAIVIDDIPKLFLAAIFLIPAIILFWIGIAIVKE